MAKHTLTLVIFMLKMLIKIIKIKTLILAQIIKIQV